MVGQEVTDPVCGMSIDAASAVGSHEYDGETYYFCNPVCLERFRNDPEKYVRSFTRFARRC